MQTINIAQQFSETPAGRFEADGPHSGEAFREKLLYPAFLKNDLVTVNLDGALGYGSSFLEEAFGGLVRVHGIKADDIKQKLRIITSRRFYEERIWRYITDADSQRKA